jgi:hypothetical protein
VIYKLSNRTKSIVKVISILLCIFTYNQITIAQDAITHKYIFGQSMTFDLTIDDAAAYEDYTLFIDGSELTVTSHSVNPTGNAVMFSRNLRDQPLPPFSYITYWWEYTDSDNNLVTTQKKTFQYTDNRFKWQSYSDGDINIFWVKGEKSAMMNAVSIILETRGDIQNSLHTSIAPAVDVYVYPSTKDLQTALRLAGFEWIAGAAYPELGVILLSAPDGNQAFSQMQRTLPHEVTHKMLYDMYGDEGYKAIPTWLVEGLASNFEPNPDPAFAIALEEADSSGKLLNLESLCYPFPDDQSVALLSYAQSDSLTKYIQKTYGWSTIRNLLSLFADEAVGCTAGLEEELKLPTLQVEREWRVWLNTQGGGKTVDPVTKLSQLSPEMRAAISIFIKDAARWLVICLILLLPFVIFGIQTMTKKKSVQ